VTSHVSFLVRLDLLCREARFFSQACKNHRLRSTAQDVRKSACKPDFQCIELVRVDLLCREARFPPVQLSKKPSLSLRCAVARAVLFCVRSRNHFELNRCISGPQKENPS
jgi:hypothetical protein